MIVEQAQRLLILDANVLIDFCEADHTVLSLISTYIGQIYIVTPVLDEVTLLEEGLCASLGLHIIEPDLGQLLLAAEKRGALSFKDHLCLILAKANGWICVTNDGRLRRECEAEDVPVLWGLELLALLIESGGLSPEKARDIARAIHQANPRYVGIDILNRFLRRIGLPEDS